MIASGDRSGRPSPHPQRRRDDPDIRRTAAASTHPPWRLTYHRALWRDRQAATHSQAIALRPGTDRAQTGERCLVAADQLSSPDEYAAERSVVDRARSGDRAAMEDLYARYFERIYRFVLTRVGNPSDAEDITSEVFIRVFEALPRFRWQDVPFHAWIFRIAYNQVVSHYRRGSTRVVRTSIDDVDVIDTKEGPEAITEARITLTEVYTVVEKLSESQRQVIMLRFGAGLSVQETAQTLKKTENNVKVLQHKAIARLQELLGAKKKVR